ncbi:MAG: hypothetical protein R3D33_04375 [Hyphomicrobiaceae bacterium]
MSRARTGRRLGLFSGAVLWLSASGALASGGIFCESAGEGFRFSAILAHGVLELPREVSGEARIDFPANGSLSALSVASSFSSASLTQFAVIDDTVQIELYDMDRDVRYLVRVIDAADGEYVGRLVATTRGEERASIDMRVTCAFE